MSFDAALMDHRCANPPLLSVVMPSFNQCQFIEAAIRSALEQDFHVLEVVVSDGGSTDGTVACLRNLQDEFGGRLQWVSEPDGGPAQAINKSLRRARGQIIGWLNSDDVYATGALSTVVAEFDQRPDLLLIYGEGEHIDESGESLGRYPTQPPSVGIDAFQEGCFICQPTVFFRRDVFAALGPLDESFKAAFDFDYWLRVFRMFPGGIAYLPQLLARSRLHSQCITRRLRRTVALEGMRVLARHLGAADPRWALTYAEESYAQYPFGDAPMDLKAHLAEFCAECEPLLGTRAVSLRESLASDRRLTLSRPGLFVGVTVDGWATTDLEVRLNRRVMRQRSVLLRCERGSPDSRPLVLQVRASSGESMEIRLPGRGPFDLLLDVLPDAPDEVVFRVSGTPSYRPSDCIRGSGDTRDLMFRIGSVDCF